MRKKLLLLLLIINLFLANSCYALVGGSRTAMLNRDDSRKIAINNFEQLLIALQNKERSKLENMFSDQALSESENIDAGLTYLFEFFQGEVISWEREGGVVSGSNNYGSEIKEVKSYFQVETDIENYTFFVLEYTVDTDHPENVGMYTLRVIKTEDKETEMGYWQDMKIPGIYIPEKK